MTCERCARATARTEKALACNPTLEEQELLRKAGARVATISSWGISVRKIMYGMRILLRIFFLVDVISRILGHNGILAMLFATLLCLFALAFAERLFHTAFHAAVMRLDVVATKVIARAIKEEPCPI